MAVGKTTEAAAALTMVRVDVTGNGLGILMILKQQLRLNFFGGV